VCGRGAADRGDVVDQRAVDVVPDRADDRHRRERDRPAQRLVAERPQVRDAAAAARDHDRVDLPDRGEVAYGGGYRGRRATVLHRRVAPDDRATPGAPLEPGEQVAPRGAPLGGDHSDPARHRGAWEQLLGLEQPLLRELPAQAREPRQQVALAREPQLLDAKGEAGR
jgi:hypothetical protein